MSDSPRRWRHGTAVVVAVLARPSLWWTALRVARGVIPRRWWARPPFLPIPSRAYLRFRKEAYYGDPRAPFRAADVLKYLMWVRVWKS
jgi:hypothetical protein